MTHPSQEKENEMHVLAAEIKRIATDIGYSHCGFTSADPFEQYATETTRRAALFPDVADHPRFPSIIDGVVSTLQGAAIMAMVLPDEGPPAELAFIERVARVELETALRELTEQQA